MRTTPSSPLSTPPYPCEPPNSARISSINPSSSSSSASLPPNFQPSTNTSNNCPDPPSSHPPPGKWRPPGTPFDPDQLPPPLSLRRHDLQVLTHKSYLHGAMGRPGCITHHEAEIQTYRPLEWIGDASLKTLHRHHLATPLFEAWTEHLLCESAGKKGEGFELTAVLQTLTTKLVRNDTIAHIAWAYGFGSKLKSSPLGPEQAPLSQQQDTLADLFKPYLGALVEDRGDEGACDIREWMAQVFSERLFPSIAGEVRGCLEGIEVAKRERKVGQEGTAPSKLSELIRSWWKTVLTAPLRGPIEGATCCGSSIICPDCDGAEDRRADVVFQESESAQRHHTIVLFRGAKVSCASARGQRKCRARVIADLASLSSRARDSMLDEEERGGRASFGFGSVGYAVVWRSELRQTQCLCERPRERRRRLLSPLRAIPLDSQSHSTALKTLPLSADF